MTRADFEPTFAGWRLAARRLLRARVAPADAEWRPTVEAQEALAFSSSLPPSAEAEEAGPPLRVPRAWHEVAEAVALHRDPRRWALLYRTLWRIAQGERALMEVATDPDVHRLLRMERAVRRSAHEMKAFVRFRGVADAQGTRWVAWFDPAHDVTARVAPFFAERFASMRWSILTPDLCAHWDGDSMDLTPGVPRSAAPAPDTLEALWRTYYASTFNPARARPAAMRAEMPKRYWRDLPEAQTIAPLLREAPGRVRRMIEDQARERAPRPVYASPAEKRRALSSAADDG